MRSWIRRSFRNRLFATVLLVTLIPIILCNVLMLELQVRRSAADQSAEAEGYLDALTGQLGYLTREVSEVTARLSESTAVRSVLRRENPDSRILYQVLFREASELREYARIDLCGVSGACLYSTADTLPSQIRDPRWGVLYEAGLTGELVYQAGENCVLEAARTVRSFDGGVLGYIVVSVSSEDMDALFSDRYGLSGSVLLLDPFWQVAYSSQTSLSDSVAPALRSQLLSGQPLSDGRGECLYSVRREETTGFYLVLQQPRAFTAQALATFTRTSVTMGLLSLALCLLYALLQSRYLSEPVHRLDRAMGAVEQGDFSIHLQTDRTDEFGRLYSSFNRMTEEFQTNLDRTVQRQQELNETQIRMLRSQLNPHFLYNTLDSIKWLGVENGVPQIAAMATDLATILRSSISGEDFVTLEQELETIDRYLEIQYIRFADRFVCETDVADRYQTCLVPRMALQPLVENAIIHGVADQDDGYIKISASGDGDDLVLCVSDNGCGMDEETLSRLRAQTQTASGRHLGLYNVNRIAQIYYGEGYGVSIESAPGAGSRVYLTIPMMRKDDSVQC